MKFTETLLFSTTTPGCYTICGSATCSSFDHSVKSSNTVTITAISPELKLISQIPDEFIKSNSVYTLSDISSCIDTNMYVLGDQLNTKMSSKWYANGVLIPSNISDPRSVNYTYAKSSTPSYCVNFKCVVSNNYTTSAYSKTFPIIPDGVIFVDNTAVSSGTGMTWADALTSITDALTVAANQSNDIEIWIKYTDENTRNSIGDTSYTLSSSIKINVQYNISIYGGFTGEEQWKEQRTPNKYTVFNFDSKSMYIQSNITFDNIKFNVNDSSIISTTDLTFNNCSCICNDGNRGVWLTTLSSNKIKFNNCSIYNVEDNVGTIIFNNCSSITEYKSNAIQCNFNSCHECNCNLSETQNSTISIINCSAFALNGNNLNGLILDSENSSIDVNGFAPNNSKLNFTNSIINNVYVTNTQNINAMFNNCIVNTPIIKSNTSSTYNFTNCYINGDNKNSIISQTNVSAYFCTISSIDINSSSNILNSLLISCNKTTKVDKNKNIIVDSNSVSSIFLGDEDMTFKQLTFKPIISPKSEACTKPITISTANIVDIVGNIRSDTRPTYGAYEFNITPQLVADSYNVLINNKFTVSAIYPPINSKYVSALYTFNMYSGSENAQSETTNTQTKTYILTSDGSHIFNVVVSLSTYNNSTDHTTKTLIDVTVLTSNIITINAINDTFYLAASGKANNNGYTEDKANNNIYNLISIINNVTDRYTGTRTIKVINPDDEFILNTPIIFNNNDYKIIGGKFISNGNSRLITCIDSNLHLSGCTLSGGNASFSYDDNFELQLCGGGICFYAPTTTKNLTAKYCTFNNCSAINSITAPSIKLDFKGKGGAIYAHTLGEFSVDDTNEFENCTALINDTIFDNCTALTTGTNNMINVEES